MSDAPFQAALVDASGRVTPGPWRDFFARLTGAVATAAAATDAGAGVTGLNADGDPVGASIAEMFSFLPPAAPGLLPIALRSDALPVYFGDEDSDPVGASLAEIYSSLPPPALPAAPVVVPADPPAAMPFLPDLELDARGEALAEMASFVPRTSRAAAFDGLTAGRVPFAGLEGLVDDSTFTYDATTDTLTIANVTSTTLATILAALVTGRMTMTLGGTVLIPPSALVNIHAGGDFSVGGVGHIMLDGVNNPPNLSFRRAEGSIGTPTEPGASAVICNLRALGWDGAAMQLGGFFRFSTDGTWVGGANRGMSWSIWLTANGSTAAPSEQVRITGRANVLIGPPTEPTTGTNGLFLADGTVPATMGSNSAGIFANDVAGTVHLFAISEAGVVTQLTGATPSALPGWARVVKAGDTSRTSNNTRTADPDLQFAMVANTTYLIRGQIVITADNTPDIKWRMTGPTAPTLVFLNRHYPGTLTAAGNYTIVNNALYDAFDAADILINGAGGVGTTRGILTFEGQVQNGANAGTFAFEWAQNTSDPGACKVHAGSWIEYVVP